MTKRGWLSVFRADEKDKAPPANQRHLALLGKLGIRPAPAPAKSPPPVLHTPRARLVFAFDATGSREVAWKTCAVPLTDALLAALPGQLDVALAVHGGGRIQMFTDFTSSLGKLRDRAARVRCKAGSTRLLDILARVLQTEGVKVVCYVGDTFEESEPRALKLADALKARGTRLIILHDQSARDFSGAEIFAEMAERTGGLVLPFDASALPKLNEDLLGAVAVLAVGGTPMLEAKQETMPAAKLLLGFLGKGKIR